MHRPPRLITLLLAAIATLVVIATAPAMASALDTPLRADLVGVGGTTVRLTLSNDSTAAAAVPTWLTGAHGIDDAILRVTVDGAPVQYAGMVAKRDHTAPGASITIPGGESSTWVLDVATAYPLTRAGTYTVRYAVAMPGGAMIISNATAITAPPGSASKVMGPSSADVGAMAIGYTGCNAGEQTAAAAALAAADTYAGAAVQYFADNRSGARYQRWFGAYLTARWNTVSAHFTAIRAVTNGTSAGFVCHDAGCTAGTYAFVYPGAPYGIYVCGAFWDAALTGTDSRAGTLIHEISHFTVVAGTNDHVYGQSGAMALATSTPAQAVANADNHEYFAENTLPVEYATYSASTPSVAFGSRAVGTTSAATTVTVTSTGDIALQVTGTVASADFTVTADTCTGATLAPAATCQVSVAFQPGAAGVRSGTLAVQGNLDITPTAVTLSGTGTASPPAPETPAAPALPTTDTDPGPAAAEPPAVVAPTGTPVIALKAATACGARNSCATTGVLPSPATRVVIRATSAAKAVRGTCAVARARGTRTYRCGIQLPRGTWTITTDALGPSGTVATKSVTKVVR